MLFLSVSSYLYITNTLEKYIGISPYFSLKYRYILLITYRANISVPSPSTIIATRVNVIIATASFDTYILCSYLGILQQVIFHIFHIFVMIIRKCPYCTLYPFATTEYRLFLRNRVPPCTLFLPNICGEGYLFFSIITASSIFTSSQEKVVIVCKEIISLTPAS